MARHVGVVGGPGETGGARQSRRSEQGGARRAAAPSGTKRIRGLGDPASVWVGGSLSEPGSRGAKNRLVRFISKQDLYFLIGWLLIGKVVHRVSTWLESYTPRGLAN